MNADKILCLGFILLRTGWGAAAPHIRCSVPAVRRSLSGSAPNQTRDFLPRIVLKKSFLKIFGFFNERKLFKKRFEACFADNVAFTIFRIF
jgi:hypothetical protein